MRKLYLFIAGGLILASSASLNAQCAGNRYHDYIFPATPTKTADVVYGTNIKETGSSQTLLMDVYQPTGDVSTSRALVIVAHGGSFIGGSKTGTDVVPLCNDLAKLGYVAVSIEYRLGMNNFPIPGPDSSDATEAVMRAVHDGRAAVRYMRKNARVGGNTYKIDTNNIFFAGVSAGGFIALHLAYLDQLAEYPNYIDTLQPGLLGGVEGLSGSQGYPSNVKAVVNICGALGDTTWIKPGDEPVLSFHGTNDNTVPYGSAIIVLSGFYPLLEVDGSSSVHEQANAMGLENCFVTWPGQDHVPEVGTSASALAHYDSTITITRNFLEHYTCGVPLNCNYTATPALGLDELSAEAAFAIYPNPANTSATVDLSQFNGYEVAIELYDAMGRQVKSISNIKTDTYIMQRDNLQSGIYFMNVMVDGRRFSKKIIFE
ncbi:MAG: alpha/beta hydrolase fold domain-containing protein [Bacteroidetes bacterium]|nr:alpha/beta hydrolase fold domain-containing protein [Bacteroidota bacterium]